MKDFNYNNMIPELCRDFDVIEDKNTSIMISRKRIVQSDSMTTSECSACSSAVSLNTSKSAYKTTAAGILLL